MKIGILRETKIPVDTRVPLTPVQCKAVQEIYREVTFTVQPSSFRCFSDHDYIRENITVQDDLSQCDIILGVKEVKRNDLMEGKTYLFFSHTTKKQAHNKMLLRTILDKHIRLIDYEQLTDIKGFRIIGFGRWAGLAGTYYGIRAACFKHTGLLLPASHPCELDVLMNTASSFSLPPLRIALTGDGRVAGGAEEMLSAFGVRKVSVEEFLAGRFEKPVYVQLDPQKYNKRIDGSSFQLQHFFLHPEMYESNFTRFCSSTDLLIMAAYWDPRAPLLYQPEFMKSPEFSISVIADITCDINGSIPSTIMTSSFRDPYYDYDRYSDLIKPAFSGKSCITVLAIDNLPTTLPREASADFGQTLIRNVIPLLIQQDPDNILKRATVTRDGCLTENFSHLENWVYQAD